MLGITRKDFISYSILPGIMPRLKELFVSGFQFIPFFMALVYQSVRLLPPGHPYTNPANTGKFGIRHVIAEAANNLTLDRKNIDQILLFACLLFGVVIIFIEILMLGMSFVAGSAMAAMPTSFAGFFLTPNTDKDLAFMMFDLIFGIPDSSDGTSFFGSCFSTGGDCTDLAGNTITDGFGNPLMGTLGWPLPIHQGLHAMFNMYNTGLMVVAALITVYFIITVLMETAQSGTPFGKRFNKVWAPVRIVVAFGLLIPFGVSAGGLNASQYIVLYAAKFGSGFATNGWKLFNDTLTGTYAGNQTDLVSKAGIPEMNGLYQFLYTAAVCAEMEYYQHNIYVRPYLVKDNVNVPPALEIQDNTYYKDAVTFANGDKQLLIRFGIEDKDLYPKERGHVKPICGELVIPLTDPRVPDATPPPERSAVVMQAYYYNVIYELWFTIFDEFAHLSGRSGGPPPEIVAVSPPGGRYSYHEMQRYTQWDKDENAVLPGPEYKSAIQQFYAKDILAAMTNPTSTGINGMDPSIGTDGAIKEGIKSSRWAVSAAQQEKGWAAAGIWYNRIAELNGALSAAVGNTPIPTLFPAVMEHVRKEKMVQDQGMSLSERFNPKMSQGDDIHFMRAEDDQMAAALWHAFHYWDTDGGATSTHTAPTGNPIIDFINGMFGTSGLYSIRQNPTVHPLAQLVGVGRSLIEAATRNLKLALVGTFVGAASDNAFLGAGAAIGVSMMMTIVTTALTIGFILYYVLPFLPFIYFFFAVGGWFKAIFEAMVGAPLWALAHIRIDGPGLAGQAAVGGYFLIFEIFLRPILIVFGLLASISIFSAMVFVLNDTWDLVTANLSGFDVETEAASGGGATSLLSYFRGPIDEFFFTVIYAIVVYILALSSFKLVDIIPSSILRWMGQSIKIFNEAGEDPGQTISGTATLGANQALGGIGQAMTKGMTDFAKSK